MMFAMFRFGLAVKATRTRHKEDDRQGRWVYARGHIYWRDHDTCVLAKYSQPCFQTMCRKAGEICR